MRNTILETRLIQKMLAAFFALIVLLALTTSFAFADDQDMIKSEPATEYGEGVDYESPEQIEPEPDQVIIKGAENDEDQEDENNPDVVSEGHFEYDIDVNVGQTQMLETEYVSEDPEDVLMWESDNPNVAVVNDEGMLTGVSVGTCTVRARSSHTETEFVFNVVVNNSIKDCTVMLSFTKKKFTGKAIEPSITVLTADGQKLDPSHYNVTYANNVNIGEAKVTVEGLGYYTDSVSKSFKIIPGNSSITKLTPSNKIITVRLKKIDGNVSYQIQYKKSSSKSWKSVKNGTKLSKTMKGLINNKKYKFRVRAYKKDNGKMYCGDWSKSKSVLAGIPISKCKIKGIKNKTYNGKKQSQTVKVYYKGKRVKAKITYGNRTKIGRRYVVIHGTGKFAGKVKRTYLIKPGKVKITEMTPYAWYDYDDDDYDMEYEYYNGDDKDNENGYYVMAVGLKCSKAPGGVSYEFAFKDKESGWNYARYGKTRAVYYYDYPKNKKVFAKVRAYKKVNGKKIYGPWSSIQSETTHYKKVRLSDYYEKKHRYIKGKILGGYKGEIIKLTIGKKTYTKKIKKNGTTSFKFRVGRIKAGTDYKVALLTKFKDPLYTYYDEAWYATKVKNGMTKHQVRYTWGKPDDTSSSSGGWVYWYYDDGSYVYFKNGKVKYWYDN